MNSEKLNSTFAHQQMPNGEVVIYSPLGTARPFLLRGLALKLFRELQSSGFNNDGDKSALAKRLGYGDNELASILDEFRREGIIGVGAKSQSKVGQSQLPISFWVHITDKCNLRCDYCYITKGHASMSSQSIERLLAILRLECANGIWKRVSFKFAGGEPFLDFPLVEKFVGEAKSKLEPLGITLSFGVITNGTIISPEICNFLRNENVFVSVSLDGFGEYNKSRTYANGRESVTEILEGLQMLQKHDISFNILTVVSNTNVEGLTELVKYASDRGIRIDLILSREVLQNGTIALDLELMKNKFIPQLARWVRMPDNNLPRIGVSSLKLQGKRSRICAAGKNYFSIGIDGEIGSCQMTIDSPLIGGISHDDRFQKISRLHSVRELPAECENCVWKYACAGGCEVLARQTGHELKTSPHCEIDKLILPELLFLEGRKIRITHGGKTS